MRNASMAAEHTERSASSSDLAASWGLSSQHRATCSTITSSRRASICAEPSPISYDGIFQSYSSVSLFLDVTIHPQSRVHKVTRRSTLVTCYNWLFQLVRLLVTPCNIFYPLKAVFDCLVHKLHTYHPTPVAPYQQGAADQYCLDLRPNIGTVSLSDHDAVK